LPGALSGAEVARGRLPLLLFLAHAGNEPRLRAELELRGALEPGRRGLRLPDAGPSRSQPSRLPAGAAASPRGPGRRTRAPHRPRRPQVPPDLELGELLWTLQPRGCPHRPTGAALAPGS